jgi:hypothetical protein
MGRLAIGDSSMLKKFSRIAIQLSIAKTGDGRAGYHTFNRMLSYGSPTLAPTVFGEV